MANLPIGYNIRLAIIRKVHRTFVECIYMDSPTEASIKCPIPHPYAGRGGGIFVGLEKDARVLIALAPQEQPYIVGFIPDRSLYFDQEGVLNAPISSTAYPEIEPGEICLKSIVGSRIDLLEDGNIVLDAGIGDDSADFELSKSSRALFSRTDSTYKFTEAGRSIEGTILRDKNEEEDPEDTALLNFLSSATYDTILSTIGRSPNDEVHLRTASVSKSVVRNPALVEKRDITYEYANSFGVRDLQAEASSMLLVKQGLIGESFQDLSIDAAARENRRTDVMDLNLRNYNHLIEKIEGTVVDIYGNVLDINRNIIKVPRIEDTTQDASLAGLRRTYNFLRRSIKYHLEINSRKELFSKNQIDPEVKNYDYNAKSHSRWFIDIDGEGLTKINIPCSSETGNIPVLNRHVVSRNTDALNDGQFKDPAKIDVRSIQFGAKTSDTFSGPVIEDPEYMPASVDNVAISTAGTAFHDLMNIASSILTAGKLRDPQALGGTAIPSMTGELNNKIPGLENSNKTFSPESNTEANAGGRSIHLNLDGSLEASIGADTADRKSIVLDLAGGIIAHYGRDRNGRSVIHQTDGDVIIQVGGPGIKDDRFKQDDNSDTEDRPGRIEIHLNRPGDGADNQRIIIDEDGITIDILGNGIFKTSGDMTISAGGKLLLTGERAYIYGSVDDSTDGTREIKGRERFIRRNGREI